MISIIKVYLSDLITLHNLRLKSLYGNTKAGKIWIAIKPMIQISFMGYVFKNVINIECENYIAYISYNLMMLNFISLALGESKILIFSNVSIISRFKIKKSIWAMVCVFNNLYIYIISLFACLLMVAVFDKVPLHWNMAFYPLYLLYACTVLFFVIQSIAVIYPYFKDLGFLIDNVLMISLWVTPIFYPIEKMPEMMFKLSYFNPFYILIAPITRLMHQGLLPTLSMHISMLVLLIVSFVVFIIVQAKLEKRLIYKC
jgi:ABC-type polysaccharide/polyol phosphate export permease